MNKPLVSIITPCYNGEKFVHRYLDSILAQIYPNIELIFINDGSTDRTEEIVLSYKNKFDIKGINFIYIYQENAGQTTALNKGIKIFKGDYLTWPDSDDWLINNSIQKRVEFLENNLDYALVRSNGAFYSEKDIEECSGRISNDKNRYNSDIFLDLIFERTFCCNGCYMLRTSEFVKVNYKREILINSAGQNWQMLIPISYKNKCGFIDDELYCILIRVNSHCRIHKNFNDLIKRNHDLCKIQLWAINQTNNRDERLVLQIKNRFIRKNMDLCILYNNIKVFDEQYNILKKNNSIILKDKINYLCVRNKEIKYI
ncbi:MAG TPA: glycosyltransferase family A protein, partial [Candidatus Paceibacterota bacterium]